MKKLLVTLAVLPLLAACAAGGNMSESDLDGSINSGPFSEERTVGTTQARQAPAVRSAAPVFESRQVK